MCDFLIFIQTMSKDDFILGLSHIFLTPLLI